MHGNGGAMLPTIKLVLLMIVYGIQYNEGRPTENYVQQFNDKDNPLIDQEFLVNVEGMEARPRLLSRHKREFTWDDVEEFYDDKNNLAMYLVLPIIVLVYGGCAVIYCIARCRRYIKRKKKKSKADDQEFLENEPLEGDEPQRHASIPVISSNHNGGAMGRDGAQTSSDVSLSMENGGETPLPWQVPGEKQLYPALGATSKGYSNKGYEREVLTPIIPPPSYDDPYPKRPDSKPPPYEEKNHNRVRRGSVEEIITLEQAPMPLNDRKRRHQGSRPSSSAVVEDNGKYDEERERARQLVRGNRERLERPPVDRNTRERTPDIISHARTQPLQPSYRPRDDSQMDASNMAKQAAQLLRLDHMGKTQGKKHKRLVFVTE